ncbi:MAG: hypothetical protein LLF95_10245 [Bacteroidales bacterium]|nr:hypothetical protein [Bacteroidales bacterium]
MRKTYTYKDLSFAVPDETDVNFTVKFISDGNSGLTLINVPGPKDPKIENTGTAFIGKGKDLRHEAIFCVSDIDNPVQQEDEIRVQYFINGVLIKEHVNLKSDEKRPMIILIIKFPAS